MVIQIDMYNKNIIPIIITLYHVIYEFDKFDSIKGHFVGALIEKIITAKKALFYYFIWRWFL